MLSGSLNGCVLAQLEAMLFDMIACIRDALGVAAAKASGSDLDFSLEVGPDVPSHVITDRTRFLQILMNLLTNSAKFTNKGSVVVRVQLMGRPHTQLPSVEPIKFPISCDSRAVHVLEGPAARRARVG
jgi:signal transduction histidine kinase